jgi:hypothetical protein
VRSTFRLYTSKKKLFVQKAEDNDFMGKTVSNRFSKVPCTLKFKEDSRHLRVQQRSLNNHLNLGGDVEYSIYKVSVSSSLSILIL